MQEFLKHDSTCQIKVAKGCRLCIRINNLLTLHARTCRADVCGVPHCHEIRDHLKQMAMRQQQMDDRRRAMMNDFYQRGPAAQTQDAEDD